MKWEIKKYYVSQNKNKNQITRIEMHCSFLMTGCSPCKYVKCEIMGFYIRNNDHCAFLFLLFFPPWSKTLLPSQHLEQIIENKISMHQRCKGVCINLSVHQVLGSVVANIYHSILLREIIQECSSCFLKLFHL